MIQAGCRLQSVHWSWNLFLESWNDLNKVKLFNKDLFTFFELRWRLNDFGDGLRILVTEVGFWWHNVEICLPLRELHGCKISRQYFRGHFMSPNAITKMMNDVLYKLEQTKSRMWNTWSGCEMCVGEMLWIYFLDF